MLHWSRGCDTPSVPDHPPRCRQLESSLTTPPLTPGGRSKNWRDRDDPTTARPMLLATCGDQPKTPALCLNTVVYASGREGPPDEKRKAHPQG